MYVNLRGLPTEPLHRLTIWRMLGKSISIPPCGTIQLGAVAQFPCNACT